MVHKVVGKDNTEYFDSHSHQEIKLDKQHVDNIIAAMTNVVHGPRGTAGSLARGINYHIAGKTGTAQVFTVKQEEKYNEDAINFKMRDHALFIALAPVEDPQIAVAVIAEHGGHGGTVAAPIAGDIIEAYLKSKKVVQHEK